MFLRTTRRQPFATMSRAALGWLLLALGQGAPLPAASAATRAVPAQYATIQAAVNAAQNGDTVLISDGTYSGAGNRDIDFGGRSITVTSQNGAAKTIIDCGGFYTSDGSGSHRGFLLDSGETSAVISGLTIKNGYQGSGSGNTLGAGVEIVGSAATLSHCIITANYSSGGGGGGIAVGPDGALTLTGCTVDDNSGSNGAGINNSGGTVTLTDCAVTNNHGLALHGAGGGILSNGTLRLTRCSISGNRAQSGGGIYNASGDAALTDCTVTGNTASDTGNAASAGGGAAFLLAGTLTLTRCAVTDNTANDYGGGFYISGGTATLTGCTLARNTGFLGGGLWNTSTSILTNCTLTGNTAQLGGGVSNYYGPLTLTHCTLTGNSAPQGAGAYNDSSNAATSLVNDIFFGDTGGPEIGGTNITASHCDVQSGFAGTGNINADPLFVSAPDNLHLQAGSPCLGAGVAAAGVTTDKDGKARPNPPAIGAYEGAAARSATTVTLASSVNPSQAGQTVVLTASLSHGQTMPTGTLQLFYNGVALSDPETLDGADQISYTLTDLSTGVYPFTVTYSGDADNQGSSGALTQTVRPPHTQIVWNHTSDGQVSLWSVASDFTFTQHSYGPYSGWTARAVSDGPDGLTHLLWTNTNGTATVWNIAANGSFTQHVFGPYAGWKAVSLSTSPSGASHLLWDKTDGTASLWTLNTSAGTFTQVSYGPYTGWTANAVADGPNVTDLLWTNVNGAAFGWRLNSSGLVNKSFGPYSGWGAVSLSVDSDDGAHLLWANTSGQVALWNVNFASGGFTQTAYGPFSGWTAKAIATDADNVTHLLWNHPSNGQASLWNVSGSSAVNHEFGPYAGWTATTLSAGP